MATARAIRPSVQPFRVEPLSALLKRTIHRLPHKTAIIDSDHCFTLPQFHVLSDRFATVLASLDTRQGDRLAIFAYDCTEFVVAFSGILKAGPRSPPSTPPIVTERWPATSGTQGPSPRPRQERSYDGCSSNRNVPEYASRVDQQRSGPKEE